MTIRVKCPVCSREVEWVDTSAYRPFCSLRCRQIDLGAWADEKYAVPLADVMHGEESELP